MKTDLIISDESTYNRISNYGKSYIHGETIETVEEAAEKIGQVTAEELRAFVQKHFDLSQMSLSLVGDLKNIAERRNGRTLDDIQNGESMRITLVTVGKIKEKFFVQAIEEYSKRLSRYCKLEIIEVADEKTPDKASEALELQN